MSPPVAPVVGPWREGYSEAELRELARPAPAELRRPTLGWEQGLKALLLDARCPWCRGTIADVSINMGEPGLTWDCEGGCNP